jgi:hypothetical protein
MIRKPFRAAAAILFALTLLGSWTATATADEDVEVQGEILDMTCYLHKGSKGRRHRACAQACAEKGLPIGILTDDEQVFLLIEDHDNPEPYAAAAKLAGQKAALKGKKYSKGAVTAIMVTEAKAP